MFSTPEFWVLIAFFLFLLVLGKRGLKAFTGAIEDHTQKISQNIEEADRLHDEALSLLNSYKDKHEKATEQAKKMVEFAEREAEEFKQKSEEELERILAQKEMALQNRIKLNQEEARIKFRDQAITEALKRVEATLQKDEKGTKEYTERALKEVMDLSRSQL